MWQLLKRLSRPSRPTRSRGSSPRTSKPMLEALEDRLVPSSTGVISSITAPNGQTYAFAVGTDGQVYCAENGPWVHLGDASGTFRQVSAGLDTSGDPVCYAIQNGTGNLYEFSPAFNWYPWFLGGGAQNYSVNLHGVCLQISATRNGECYAIGTDYAVYLNDARGSWSLPSSFPYGGVPVQISAGVDQWGQDEVYALMTNRYVGIKLHDGSWWSFSFIQANQISAGIGNNSTGNDFYYLDTNNQLHSFEGSTDTMLGIRGTQISAGLTRNGMGECYVLGFDNALYTVTGPRTWTYDGGWMTQISGAQNDMVFVVVGSNQIWAFDPNQTWAAYWSTWARPGSVWYWWGGVSANPFA
jgi:hypothetical protein